MKVDIYGNPTEWIATGRRIVDDKGNLHAKMRRGDSVIWPLCRPHEDCVACEGRQSHDGCPISRTAKAPPRKDDAK